jgi:predicted flap endonuclease-1-like 5' DNA nuclease
MGVQLQENWIGLIVVVLLVLLLAVWLFARSRRTRVEIERKDEDGAPARRNQALIDAPSAAGLPPAEVPPPAPAGLAGVGEAVAAAAAPAPIAAVVHGSDDLTRIKGVGPQVADQLHALGVTSFAQIAAWDEADVERIDGQLGRFQGRIRRDDWRTQAQLLAADDTAGYEARFGKL